MNVRLTAVPTRRPAAASPVELTAGQTAWLAGELESRERLLGRRLEEHRGAFSAARDVQALREQGGHDHPQTDGEREVDEALGDLEAAELGAVRAALHRLREGHYGACADCGETIPFDRLRAEPWARRCVECESRHERAARRGA